MKSFAVLGFALVLCSAPAVRADESKHESLAKEAIATLTKLTETLETIKDADSARKAEKDLNAAVDKLIEQQKKLDALGNPSEEETKRIKEKYQPEIKKTMERLLKAYIAASSSGPEAKAIVSKAMEKMPKRK